MANKTEKQWICRACLLKISCLEQVLLLQLGAGLDCEIQNEYGEISKVLAVCEKKDFHRKVNKILRVKGEKSRNDKDKVFIWNRAQEA